MNRRHFLGAVALAAPGAAVGLPLVIEPQLISTRQVGGALLYGAVLDLGVGAGKVAEIALGSSVVASYTGVELQMPLFMEASRRWPDATFIRDDAVNYMERTDRRFDCIAYDLDPMLYPDGRHRPGRLIDFPDVLAALRRVLTPKGGLLTWWSGGCPDIPDFEPYQTIKMRDGAGEPWVVALHKRLR